MDLNSEVRVVAHAHEVPCEVCGLKIGRLIPGAAPQLLALHQHEHRRLNREEAPAPPLVVGLRCVRVLELWVLDFAEVPCRAAVVANLHPRDLATTATVGVASDAVVLVARRERHDLSVMRTGNRRVDVELVEEILRLEPPALLLRQLSVHVRRHDAVVVEVVVVLARCLAHADRLEPLDHAAANPSGDDHAHREAVVRLQALAVVVVSDHDVPRRVHGGVDVNGRAVLAIGQVLGAHKLHVPRLALAVSRFHQDVPQPHTSPEARRVTGGAPVEADGLLHHVLLLAAVASAYQRHGNGERGHRNQLGHGQRERRVDHSVDADDVLVPALLRAVAVVADIVQRGRRDEALMEERLQRRLAVERVFASEADEIWVSRDPAVRRFLVSLVDGCDHVCDRQRSVVVPRIRLRVVVALHCLCNHSVQAQVGLLGFVCELRAEHRAQGTNESLADPVVMLGPHAVLHVPITELT